MTETEYEKAWAEGEDEQSDAAPATKAVKAAKAAADKSEGSEFIRAYSELDAKEGEDKGGDK
jgi:hypothetical protein